MNREERRRQEKLTAKHPSSTNARTHSTSADAALLREAQLHHQAGRLDDADRAYRSLLDRTPTQPDALQGLGLLTYRRGRFTDAVEWLAQACHAGPGNPMCWFNHGVVLQRAGRAAEALDSYRTAIRLNPRYLDARMNLGNAYKELGRLDEARAAYEEILRTNPEHAEAHNNLGVVLKEQGCLTEAAEAYRRAITLKPTHAEAQNNLGLVLMEQDGLDEAVRCFERALEIQPGYTTARYNLGIAALWQEDRPRALDCFRGTAAIKQDHRRPVTDAVVFRSRLKHDAEQVRYLLDAGLLDESCRPYGDALERLRRSADEAATVSSTETNRIAFLPTILQSIAPSFNRLLYLAPCDEVAGGALHPDLDCAAIEARYHAAQPEVTYADGLLTEEALTRLRQFCRTSTVWKKDYDNGYIGAFLGDGFATPLLLQIAEELRRRLPGIFGGHRLTQAWAFSHDSARRGLNIHADAAAVNVNFWITPDASNLNPERGGLVVWDREAPRDWDFKTYNSDKNRGKIDEWLKAQGAREITIPYRANRAVLFNSDLFHETDDCRFRDGAEHRRINITLLYGHRHRASTTPQTPPHRPGG